MNKLIIAAVVTAAAVFANSEQNTEQGAVDAVVSGTGPVSYESGPTLKAIRNSAFADHRSVVSIRANFAESVGSGAFRGCSSLVRVELGSITNVSRFAGIFSGCGKLENVSLTGMDFTPDVMNTGYPWGAPSIGVIFHFRNGDFDRFGRKLD